MLDARVIPEHGDAATPEQATFVGKTPEQAAEMSCS